MLKIEFTPSDFSDEEILLATYVYMFIWENDGKKIEEAAEKISGLKFKEERVVATVHKGKGKSHPLTLSAYAKSNGKRASLVHELLHRLIVDNSVSKLGVFENQLEAHKILDLILYDVLTEAYGKELAEWRVNFEKNNFPEAYKEAWDWALAFDKEGRKREFQKIVAASGNKSHSNV